MSHHDRKTLLKYLNMYTKFFFIIQATPVGLSQCTTFCSIHFVIRASLNEPNTYVQIRVLSVIIIMNNNIIISNIINVHYTVGVIKIVKVPHHAVPQLTVLPTVQHQLHDSNEQSALQCGAVCYNIFCTVLCHKYYFELRAYNYIFRCRTRSRSTCSHNTAAAISR